MKPTMGTEQGYSPEVAEILNRKPHWIVRYGMILVALTFAFGLAGTRFIPYPQRLNCIAKCTGTAATKDQGSVFQGVITLPSQYGEIVRHGMPVRIVLIPPGKGELKTARGRIETISADSLGNQILLTVLFQSDPDAGQAFLAESQCNAQITVGNSNLLQQIFNPVITLIKGARK